MPKNKHLTNVERQQIEEHLKYGVSIKQIAKSLIKAHRPFHGKSVPAPQQAINIRHIAHTIGA
jgi:hypothetical protein